MLWTVDYKAKKIKTLIRAKETGYAAFGWGYEKFLKSKPMVVIREQDGKVFHRRFYVRALSGFDAIEPIERDIPVGDYRDGFVMALFEERVNHIENISTLHAVWAIGSPYDFRFLEPPSKSNRGVVKIKI